MRCRWKINCLPHNRNLKSDTIRADPYHTVHDTWRRLQFKHKTLGALGLTRGSDAQVSLLTVAVRLGVLWGRGACALTDPTLQTTDGLQKTGRKMSDYLWWYRHR